MSEPPITPSAKSVPPPHGRHRALLRLGAILSVLLVAAWFASGGYDRLTAPNPRWKLPNGDTIEVLTYDYYYQANFSLRDQRISGAHYLRLRFRSSPQEPARDRRDVLAAAQVLCPTADSARLHEILIQPTRPAFFHLLSASSNYVFRVWPGARCEEVNTAK